MVSSFPQISLGLVLILTLAGCAGTNWERSLAPDPRLTPTPSPSPVVEPSPSPSPEPVALAGLDRIPAALQPLVQDVINLGVIPASEVQLDQPATRRQFARWLMAVQQRLYRDQIERQVRPATFGTTPVFADVPRSDPDFTLIQGLAEAGIIPSRLTGGSSGPLRFEPDRFLTRETLITWKVSLDIPGKLPTGTVQAVTETWGFGDAAQISPLALGALVVDYRREPSTVRQVWGRTRLFLPDKPVSQAQALAALWFCGTGDALVTAREALK